jgi:hypothetical protein
MKALLASLFLVCAGFAVAQEAPWIHRDDYHPPMDRQGWRRFPLRGFANGSINLTPLMDWWDKSAPEGADLPRRPLTAWFRIVGEKIGDSPNGWIVQGRIATSSDDSRPAIFILRNPPLSEKDRFDALNLELAQLKRRAGINGLPRHQVLLSMSRNGDGSIEKNYSAPADPVLYAQALPIWKELDKIPSDGTNYLLDFMAGKLGYLQDGSHREVFALGVIHWPVP